MLTIPHATGDCVSSAAGVYDGLCMTSVLLLSHAWLAACSCCQLWQRPCPLLLFLMSHCTASKQAQFVPVTGHTGQRLRLPEDIYVPETYETLNLTLCPGSLPEYPHTCLPQMWPPHRAPKRHSHTCGSASRPLPALLNAALSSCYSERAGHRSSCTDMSSLLGHALSAALHALQRCLLSSAVLCRRTLRRLQT